MADKSLAETISSVAGPAAAGLGILEGGIELFSNLKKEKEAKAKLASLKDPFYTIKSEYEQNRNIAGNLAQGGLPQAELDYTTSENQRGLGASISGLLQGGGTPSSISKIFDTYTKSIDRTGAESAQQHLKNIDYYMNANKDLAGQKNIQFGFNEVRPYERKYKQYSLDKNAAEQNAYAGANQIIGSTSALGTSLQNNSLLDKLFAGEDGSTDTIIPRRFTNSGIDNKPTY